MAEDQQAPIEQTVTEAPSQLTPHRGVAILVLGISGLALALPGCFCCVLLDIIPLACGIIAWIMGSKDLREMAAGRMDTSGEGMTKAGKICGIIGVILSVILIVVSLVFLLIFLLLPHLMGTWQRQGY